MNKKSSNKPSTVLTPLISVSLLIGISSSVLAADEETGGLIPKPNIDKYASSFLEEVTVTARRKEENAQDIPVSVTALSNEALYRENISEIDDLTASVPGVNFTASGGANNTVFSIRGRSRGVFGNALPAVTTYVNEVPLSTWGGNIPTYDMASVEVLKGPQGTLFGRNSTAGAVLITTQRPDFELGGNVTAKVGAYNTQVIDGAINLPILADSLFLRIAGQIDQRDGHTEDKVFTDSDDFGNHDRENFRVSLLFEPSDMFSNLTIYEVNRIDERGANVVPVGFDLEDPTAFVNLLPYYNGTRTGLPPSSPPCDGDPSCDISVIQAQQASAGNRAVWTDIKSVLEQKLTSFSNTTRFNFERFTIKNIFGYREVNAYSITDIDGTQLPMIGADTHVNYEQYSNELQISGEAFDNSLDYIAGIFWLKSEPNGPERLALQTFAASETNFDAPFVGALNFAINGAFGPSAFYTDTSQAVFGQISYDLSNLYEPLYGLSMDIGVRHTKDESEMCALPGNEVSEAPPEPSDCTESISASFEKTSYNIGLNYQLNEMAMIYAVTRSGYRAGGINSPIFSGTLVDFQTYEPETVEDIEVGYKSDWELGNYNGRFNLSLFNSDYEGVHYALPTQVISMLLVLDGGIDNDGDPSNDPTGGLYYDNAGEANVKGAEFEFLVQLTENLSLATGGSYIEKSLDTEFTIPSNFYNPSIPEAFSIENSITSQEVEAFVFLGAPRWSYTASLDYMIPTDPEIGDVILSADYFRMGKIHYGGNVYADAYEIIDVRLDWMAVHGSSIDLALYVSNLLDKEALVGSSNPTAGIGVNSAIFNEPRMWGASIRYTF